MKLKIRCLAAMMMMKDSNDGSSGESKMNGRMALASWPLAMPR